MVFVYFAIQIEEKKTRVHFVYLETNKLSCHFYQFLCFGKGWLMDLMKLNVINIGAFCRYMYTEFYYLIHVKNTKVGFGSSFRSF